ncbi:LysR family pca operon transcriptional activator [Rhizobium giardinii]|uniref:LysR family pca operon transcriptional activator n=1 Tax=Rhizobium giardinii TaxID=56731 RepID=A0A7W8X751_9HYPH|nr:LysR family pca operon transcriptional activator [Rhizobium giardinii]
MHGGLAMPPSCTAFKRASVTLRLMPRAMKLFLAECTGATIKIVKVRTVLLEQLRVGDLDLVVRRLAAPEKMAGFSFEHLYSEKVVFCVRTGHPLLSQGAIFSGLNAYKVLMPTRASIIRPCVVR